MKKTMLLIGLILALAILPLTASAEVIEVSNKCIFDKNRAMEYCETELEFKDIPDISIYKADMPNYMTKKEAFSMGKTITNSIIFDRFEWEKEKIKISGWIKPATQNFWGIKGIYNSSWWNASYTLRFQVNVSSTIDTDEWALINITFPTNNANFTDECKDIRIIDALNETNLLEWHFEGYGSSVYGCNQPQTIIWVYALILADNTTSFYIYHNNTLETEWGNSTTQTCNDHFAIFHFGEGTGSNIYEVCSGLAGTITGSTWKNQINDGEWESIGHGLNFDGNDNVNFGDNFDITGSLTMELWYIKPASIGTQTQEPFGKHGASSNAYWFLMAGTNTGHCNNNNPAQCVAGFAGTDATPRWSNYGVTNYGGWSYSGFVYNSTNLTHFANGTQKNTVSHSTNPSNNADVFYFGFEARWGTYWKGNITEARISNVARSADFIKINYDLMRYSHLLVDIGGLEQNVTPNSPVNLTNVTVIDYLCIGNYSVRNETFNDDSTLTYTLCDYGCNENNPLIDVLGHDPNFCNPDDLTQMIIAVLVVVSLLALYRRFK